MPISKTKHYFLMKKRYYFKKIQYFLMRHTIPVSPRDLWAFRTGPKVFANSMPKGGTNLLGRMLNLLPCVAPQWTYHLDATIPGYLDQLRAVRNGQVVCSHLPWSESLVEILKSKRFAILFIIRDLRDVAVSDIHYIVHKSPDHPLHRYFSSQRSDDERLMAYIRGVPAHCFPSGAQPKAWENFIESILPWLDDPNCLTIRFEDLVGSAGGGSDKKQVETVRLIIKHLGIKLSEEVIEEIAAKTFYTGARTFRKGQIGDWRNYFTKEHKQAFKEVHGDTLIRLDYEKDNDW
jgi:hypothetical protein